MLWKNLATILLAKGALGEAEGGEALGGNKITKRLDGN